MWLWAQYLAKSTSLEKNTPLVTTHTSSQKQKRNGAYGSSNWQQYLRGIHFELITDKVVAAIIRKDVPTRRQNLLVRLFEFDFTVTHRKGELNRNADFFSRWAAYKEWEEDKLLTPCREKTFFPQLHTTPTDTEGGAAEQSGRVLAQQSRADQEQAVMQCCVGELLPAHAGSALVDVSTEPDFSLVRQKIVQEQRADPKLNVIISN